MTKQDRPQVLLDWATVSYRSIMRATVLVALLAALGGLFFYLRASLRGSPEELALLDIGRAERLLREAGQAAGSEPSRAASLGRADRLLKDARAAYGRHAFPEARAAALQSQAFSEKIIAGTGDESFAARIFRFEGDVKVKRIGEFAWSTLSANAALKVGDQIKTSRSGSAQIIYFDGTITTIKPGSLVEIRELSEDPATRVRRVQEKVNWGGVSATTSGGNAEGSVHEVATASSTTRASSRAQFDVTFDAGTGSARTEVHSGTTEVRAAGQVHTLQPLERLDVGRGEALARASIPPAPGLLDPADSRVFLAATGSPDVLLRWAVVDPAGRYRLQLSRTALFSAMVLDKADVHATSVRIPGLGEGTYYWRVSALNGTGTESAFSEIRRFKVSPARARAAEDRTPPPLLLSEFLPSGHLLIINGKTEPGALLSIEGQAIDVYDDGTFTAVVRMKHEGNNAVTIVAQDSAGNENRQLRSVFVESF
jgi:hypothetical protein